MRVSFVKGRSIVPRRPLRRVLLVVTTVCSGFVFALPHSARHDTHAHRNAVISNLTVRSCRSHAEASEIATDRSGFGHHAPRAASAERVTPVRLKAGREHYLAILAATSDGCCVRGGILKTRRQRCRQTGCERTRGH
jgi:hypothetical protein